MYFLSRLCCFKIIAFVGSGTVSTPVSSRAIDHNSVLTITNYHLIFHMPQQSFQDVCSVMLPSTKVRLIILPSHQWEHHWIALTPEIQWIVAQQHHPLVLSGPVDVSQFP